MNDKGYIHFLKAGFGDAFILHCRKGDIHGVVVVDGGYGHNPLRNKFLEEIEKVDNINLMVLTHPDDDHLMGIKKFIECHLKDDPFPVDEIWANCAPNVEFDVSNNVSARGAKRLSETLDTLQSSSQVIWKNDIIAPHCISLPFADIFVVGPSLNTMKEFNARYRDKIGFDDSHEATNVAARSFDDDYNTDMETLASRRKDACNLNDYNEASNASSISFILKCDDFSILMLGDSFPTDIIQGLSDLGYSADNPLKVDYVKLAHHGSAANISNNLLDIIECSNFIVSTNGMKYRHPDREALANVLCHINRNKNNPVNFYFNYMLNEIEAAGKHIFNENLDNHLNYTIKEPSDPNISGITLYGHE